MPARLALCALAAGLGLLASGCTSTYLRQEETGYELSAGLDTGPEEEAAFVQPAVIEYLLSQPEANLVGYYDAVYASGGSSPGVMHQELYARALSGLRALEPDIRALGAELVDASTPGALAARAVAKKLAPHAVTSLRENGYARLSWGQKVDEDKTLKLAANLVYITVRPAADLVTLHRSDLHSMWDPLRGVNYDVADIEGVWDEDAQVDYVQVAARIKKMTAD